MRFSYLLFLLLLLAGPTQAITLKIATLAPDGTSWMVAMRSAAKQIKQETGGRVNLKFYPGGVMGNDGSVLRKLRVGQLHGGALTSGGLASVTPDIQLYSLPFLFRSTAEVDYVRSRMDRHIIEKLQKAGLVSFGISEVGFAYLMSQSAFNSADNLKQLKIWAPEGDELSFNAFRAIGITPVPLAITDVLTGLQTHLIDTVATTPIGAIALQWHSRVQHLADLPLTYIYGTLVISQRAINKLSADDRRVLQSVLQSTIEQIKQQNRTDSEKALQALRNQGIQIFTPDISAAGDWRAAMERVITNSNQQTRMDQTLVNEIRRQLAEFRGRER